MLSIINFSSATIGWICGVSVIWCISFAANVIGLFCLIKSPHDLNQRIILMNLNFTELTFTITIPLRLIPYFTACPGCKYLSRFESWIGFWYYASLFFVTFDRLLCMRLTIRYRQIILPRRLKTASGLISMTCFLCSVPFYFLDDKSTKFIVNVLIYPIMDFLFVGFAVTVYLYIFYKLKKYRKELGDNKKTGNFVAEKSFRKSYLTPMLIILSFMIFIQIPEFHIIFTVYLTQHTTSVNETNERSSADEEKAFVNSIVVYGCYFTGFLSDSVIYMYCNKTVSRSVLKRLCLCTCARKRPNLLRQRGIYFLKTPKTHPMNIKVTNR